MTTRLPTLLEIITAIRPDVLVKGADWQGRRVVSAALVRKYGGEVVFAPLETDEEGVLSTSRIVENIRRRTGKA